MTSTVGTSLLTVQWDPNTEAGEEGIESLIRNIDNLEAIYKRYNWEKVALVDEQLCSQYSIKIQKELTRTWNSFAENERGIVDTVVATLNWLEDYKFFSKTLINPSVKRLEEGLKSVRNLLSNRMDQPGSSISPSSEAPSEEPVAGPSTSSPQSAQQNFASAHQNGQFFENGAVEDVIDQIETVNQDPETECAIPSTRAKIENAFLTIFENLNDTEMKNKIREVAERCDVKLPLEFEIEEEDLIPSTSKSSNQHFSTTLQSLAFDEPRRSMILDEAVAGPSTSSPQSVQQNFAAIQNEPFLENGDSDDIVDQIETVFQDPETDCSVPSTSQACDERETFRGALRGLEVGSDAFVKQFELGEAIHFQNRAVRLRVFETADDFMREVNNYGESPSLIKRGILPGLHVPNVNFENFRKTFTKRGEARCSQVTLIDSKTRISKAGYIDDILKAMALSPRKNCYNMLSMEVSKLKLPEEIAVPTFVASESIVDRLDEEMKTVSEELEKKLKEEDLDEETRKKLIGESKRLDRTRRQMPRFEKFFIMSMKEGFTDVHIDSSGTSVFYHVIKGKKIFYVAPPTEDVLKMYEESEMKPFGSTWKGDDLFEEFQRVAICEGQTAILPSGWVHFVYTPEDSIVVGGNFLNEKFMEMQFRLTELEKKSVEAGNLDESNLFTRFYSVMFAFLEFLLLPLLNEEAARSEEKLAVSKTLLEKLESLPEDVRDVSNRGKPAPERSGKRKTKQQLLEEQEDRIPWYTAEEKQDLVKKLRDSLVKFEVIRDSEENRPKKRKASGKGNNQCPAKRARK